MQTNNQEFQRQFDALQSKFAEQYRQVFENKLAPKTIVVIPSLTLDHEILSKIKGHFYYEERMLCMLMLLRMPETRVTFVTSIPISPLIIDYYLHMLPGITQHHARSRLTLLSCYDSGNLPLTNKILNRPRLIKRIRQSIPDCDAAHLVYFNTTDAEKELAIKLNIPMYACDPSFNYLGSKSGSRSVFKECGVNLPPGYEDLYSESDLFRALTKLRIAYPDISKAVVKINEGFSGDGNAIFVYPDISMEYDALYQWIQDHKHAQLKIVAKKLSYDHFIEKLIKTGGIVEAFVTGTEVTSPSVQCRINPLGEVCVISTHDQVLSGENQQIFAGANFPASDDYSVELSEITKKIGQTLRDKGALGRFGVDFMSVKSDDGWNHYAIEINLRKGGTTHPFLMLQFLTEGYYDSDLGSYVLPDGRTRYYFATDNLQNDAYKGLTPLDLIDIAMHHALHFDHTKCEGVMFHIISALSQYGKLGLVSIASSPQKAIEYYQRVIDVLNDETLPLKQD